MMTSERTPSRITLAIIAGFLFLSGFSCTSVNGAKPEEATSHEVNSVQFQAGISELESLYRKQRYSTVLEKANQLIATTPEIPEYHLYKASALAKLETNQTALDYLTRMIDEFPANFGLYAVRGKLLLQMGYIESAKKDYKQAYQNGYKSIDVLKVLLSVENEAANFETALSLVNEALELEAENAELWFNRAQLEIRAGQIDKAESSSNKAIQLDETTIRYQQLYYEILSYQKKADKAYQHIENAHQNLPFDVWISSRYATELVNRKRYEQAKQILLNAIQAEPYETQLLFQLASIYFYEKKWNQAVEYLEAGIKIDPDDSQARIQLAKVYFQLQQPEKALSELRLAREAGAQDPFVYETLARYYNRANDTFEAERIIFEGLEINPKNYNLVLEYARILEKRSDYKEAIKAYEEVLKSHPNEVNILGKLGHLNRLAGKTNQSIGYFKQAIELKPELMWIRSYYTELLLDLEKWDQALSEVTYILSATPDDYWALAQKAQIEYRLEDYPSAFESINLSIALRPELAQLKRIKGEILESLGEYEKAEIAFQEVLQQMPENEYILTKLAYIQLKLGKAEALRTIKTSLDKDDFDISAIELYLYLTDQSYTTWRFAEDSPEADLYRKIILKEIDEIKRTVAQIDEPTHPQVAFLRVLQQTLLSNKVKSNDLDRLEKIPDLTAWNYFYLGMIALVSDEFERAATHFESGLSQDPDNIWLKVKLAYAYQQTDRNELAVDLLNEYLASAPFQDNVWAKLRLALNYDLVKQYRQAERVYLEILGINPNESLALNNLAWMYLTAADTKMNKKDDALELALRAVELNPTAANLDTLAEAYYQTKAYQKALKTIERALDKDKNDMDDFKKTQKKILKALEENERQSNPSGK